MQDYAGLVLLKHDEVVVQQLKPAAQPVICGLCSVEHRPVVEKDQALLLTIYEVLLEPRYS